MTDRYPAGTGTFSKARNQFPANAPEFAVSGKGSHILGSDGRDYIDWTCGLGAISLGHSDDDVNEAVRRQLERGTIFGLPTQIEFDMADALADFLPWAVDDYGVKFGKHGSDVTQAAIRAARFITGRQIVVSQGYHGWGDSFCPNKNGIPIGTQDMTQEVTTWRDSGIRGDKSFPPSWVAAIIVEPDTCEDLAELRGICDREGILLIFDEVLTGGRMPGFTYAKWKGVIPDFICLAKAISNGVPLSVIAGKAEYMKVFAGDIGYSFTYGGETTSLAAGIATLKKYRELPVIERLWEIGGGIQDWFNSSASRRGVLMSLNGLPPRTVVGYPSLAHKTLFSQEMIRRGILWTVGATACYAHTSEDIRRTVDAITETLDIFANLGDADPATLVEGPIIGLPFKKMTTL